MKTKLKKAMALFSAFSLGAAIIGTIPYAGAEDNETVEIMDTAVRTLSVEFMGRGANPVEKSPGSARLKAGDITDPNVLGEFWVGVAVDKVNDLPLFTDGVYSLEIAFEYDPAYIEPFTDSTYTTWQSAVEHGNLKDPVTNDKAWWNENAYSIEAYTNLEIDTETNRENISDAQTRKSDEWKMCTVGINYDNKNGLTPAPGRRFDGLSAADKQYLVKLPFKLKKAPAQGDENQDPTVLSFVRGPEVFDIGSAGDGTEPNAAWEYYPDGTTDTAILTDQKNLKNLFSFAGDISLFGQGGAITDIIGYEYIDPNATPKPTSTPTSTPDPSVTPDPSATPAPTGPAEYELSETEDLNKEGFREDADKYYISVPNETEKITLNITSSELPVITSTTEANITATLDTGQTYKTSSIGLAELNKDVNNGGVENGYNTTITVSAGGKTYTVYVRRLLKPKIVLKPGNSPFGLIERMSEKYLGVGTGWNDTKIKAAQDSFVSGSSTNAYKFKKTQYTPTGANNTVSYTPKAWGGATTPDKNMDINVDAIFVYNGEQFTDPGFEAYDSEGIQIGDSDVSRSITIRKMPNRSVNGMQIKKLTSETIPISAQTNSCTITDLKNKIICPDTYKMIYSFVDPVTNDTITEERPIVVVWLRGDADMSGQLTTGDAGSLRSIVMGKVSLSAKDGSGNRLYSESVEQLFTFRMADADMSAQITTGDPSTISSLINGKIKKPHFYK